MVTGGQKDGLLDPKEGFLDQKVVQIGSDFAIASLLSINTYQTDLEVYKSQLKDKLQIHIKV